jgi:hypothetical protein
MNIYIYSENSNSRLFAANGNWKKSLFSAAGKRYLLSALIDYCCFSKLAPSMLIGTVLYIHSKGNHLNLTKSWKDVAGFFFTKSRYPNRDSNPHPTPGLPGGRDMADRPCTSGSPSVYLPPVSLVFLRTDGANIFFKFPEWLQFPKQEF